MSFKTNTQVEETHYNEISVSFITKLMMVGIMLGCIVFGVTRIYASNNTRLRLLELKYQEVVSENDRIKRMLNYMMEETNTVGEQYSSMTTSVQYAINRNRGSSPQGGGYQDDSSQFSDEVPF